MGKNKQLQGPKEKKGYKIISPLAHIKAGFFFNRGLATVKRPTACYLRRRSLRIHKKLLPNGRRPETSSSS